MSEDSQYAEITTRILKLMRLAGNNPNAHEAQAAALKAQRLIAEYCAGEQPGMDELVQREDDANEDDANTIVQVKDSTAVFEGNPWGVSLARAIADNFRCYMYLDNDYRRVYGRHYHRMRHVVFIGYATDARAAQATFSHLFEIGRKLADREVREARKRYGTAVGVRNSFLVGDGTGGYVGGIRSALEQQTMELMLVRSSEVDREAKRIMRGFRSVGAGLRSTGYHASVASRSYAAGRDAAHFTSATYA